MGFDKVESPVPTRAASEVEAQSSASSTGFQCFLEEVEGAPRLLMAFLLFRVLRVMDGQDRHG